MHCLLCDGNHQVTSKLCTRRSKLNEISIEYVLLVDNLIIEKQLRSRLGTMPIALCGVGGISNRVASDCQKASFIIHAVFITTHGLSGIDGMTFCATFLQKKMAMLYLMWLLMCG